MHNVRFAVVTLFVLTAANGYAKTEVWHAASDREIAALFDRWNASLQTLDPQKVVANYAPNSVPLPTVSAKPG